MLESSKDPIQIWYNLMEEYSSIIEYFGFEGYQAYSILSYF